MSEIRMREIYDPVYYPPVIQGFDEYRHHQQNYRHPPPQYQPPPPVTPKSSGSGSSVLGKFLKLGKSKSDVSPSPSLFSNGGLLSSGGRSGDHGSVRNSSSSRQTDEVDDFRLSPSVISRGPVEKMVHNKVNKRDVSRSHSWIYGSVKLASDLPFGYGDQFGGFQDGPGGTMEGGSGPQGHYLHTHGIHSMQIPRCQLPADYSCTCGGEIPPEYGIMQGGSVRNGPRRRAPPCQGCARDMAMKYALPKNGRGTTSGAIPSESFVSSVRKLTWKSLKQVVKKRPSIDTLKRMPPGGQPPPGEYLSAPIVPMPYLSPSGVAAQTATQPSPLREPMNPMANQNPYGHGGILLQSPPMSPQSQQHPQQDYFFPEKKQFFASCNDIYEKGSVAGPPSPPNHVTASVRVRPKRTRQPWQVPSEAPTSEFGPVPNYEEEGSGAGGNPAGVYHSEWDLRNVMSYDMWMNATSNVKPRQGTGPGPTSPGSAGASSGRSHSADARHYHSSGAINLPPPDYGNPLEATTFRPPSKSTSSASSSSSSRTITNGKGSVSSSKSLTSLNSPLPSSSSLKSSLSSSQSTDTLKISSFANTPSNPNKTSLPTSSPGGIVKRGSILASDVSAYQLLKQQSKNKSPPERSASQPSSLRETPSRPHQSILKNGRQPQPPPQPDSADIEDAFSESSDDLSDNAITGSADTASIKSRSSSSTSTRSNSTKKPGVRIAGQGIRISPNSKKAPASNSQPPKASHIVTTTAGPIKTRKAQSESDSDLWSDCHADTIPRKNSGSSVSSIKVSPPVNPIPPPKRQPLVTFEKSPPSPPKPPQVPSQPPPQPGSKPSSHYEADMEFEVYEVDHRRPKPPQASTPPTKSSENVVSLNVASPPPSNPPQKSGYIKNTKATPVSGSPSQASSSPAKFGALRRRKSRSSQGPTSPGKLLQETIYEEDSPGNSDNDNRSDLPQRGQSPHPSKTPVERGKKHAVKIQIGGTTATASPVKPILKNNHRNPSTGVYEAPTPPQSNESSTSNYFLSPDRNLSRSEDDNSSQIYFDSSISTTSAKKKVQFDQSKVVVCGGSSSSGGSEEGSGPEEYDYENDDSDQWSNKSSDDESHHQPQQPAPPVALKKVESPPVASDPQPKQKSAFEEEVARKAATMAASRQKREEEQAKTAAKSCPTPAPSTPSQAPPQLTSSPATQNGNTTTVSVSNGVTQRKVLQFNDAKQVVEVTNKQNSPAQVVVNPNSLLFHDTTRIRLNQSRPALHDSTFKLPNQGSPLTSTSSPSSRGSKLKQSNSFRSVSSVALRPREPPPPPPTFSKASGPKVLQKALSTNTLLTKSTEKLNLSMALNSSKSHYGPGGRLLPSKSQISLPVAVTTTSQTAMLASSSISMETLKESPSKSGKFKSSLASRSKSLTDRCQALELVLREQKSAEEPVPRRLVSLRPCPSLPTLATLPKDDMDSKSIEIVTKENDVSEIRIYSANQQANHNTSDGDENLPYQGIIYESTKTIINSEPPPKIAPPKASPSESMHYAASDIIPVATPKPSPPFAHPPLPPIPPGEVEQEADQESTTHLTYNEPIDKISRFSQLPLPSIPTEEPLYDDVVSHVIPDNTSKFLPGKSILKNGSPPHQLGELPPLPPPVPPHRSPLSSSPPQHEVVSSTLPCLACPPTLPPPNLPSKSLSEFHNRPLVIQENEEELLIEEVDNLYNDIATPSATLKSSTAANFAVAMKEAFLGAISKRSSGDFSDRRSIHSTGSGASIISTPSKKSASICQDIPPQPQLIYDDYTSLSSGAGSTSSMSSGQTSNHVSSKPPQQLVPLPAPPPQQPADKSLQEPIEEPLYDDVLNISNNQDSSKTQNGGNSSSSPSEYHSSTCSDSGTEDLPPPLPSQGPPPLPKDLSLISFPIITSPPSTAPPKEDLRPSTRSLLTELNEKLTKLNVSSPPSQPVSVSSTADEAPCSSSPGGSSTDASSGEFNSDSFHISKVVISTSSESSGVEEDYNSERNYSLSLTGSQSSSNNSTSSRAGSDNETPYESKKSSETQPHPPSQAISMARGKFLENMKLSMLGGGSGGNPRQGLLMMTSSTVEQNEEPIEEPIYEEIGDLAEKAAQAKPLPVDIQDHEPARSPSPLYADAFDAKSMFDGASRSEILSFLESIRDRLTGAESSSSSESQSSSISSTAAVLSAKKDEILSESCRDEEKMGVLEEEEMEEILLDEEKVESESCDVSGPGESLEIRKLLCPDCNDDIDESEENNNATEEEVGVGKLLGSGDSQGEGKKCCKSCNRKRNEKKEIIMEIYETELKYGRDLRIVSEEFYKPIQVAGLLTTEQLDQIFLNVDELIQMNLELTGRLKQEINRASQQRKQGWQEGRDKKEDELSEVNVGRIFLELGQSMMSAFESYCTRQASAGALLSQLEKEKELLRIFLRVSQMENTVLRRMNLPAFLMVPVQRVTRYPLLLSRLLKVTPVDHFSRDEIQSAQEKIEQHLEHMNKTTREVASVKLWRRISIINSSSSGGGPVHRRSNSDLDASNIRIRKMAMDVLDWTAFSDVTCVLDNQLGSVHLNGKLTRNIYGCLLVRGKDLDTLASKIQDQDPFFPPAGEDTVKEVKLVLVRVKNTRFCLVREPLCLSKCVVSQGENEFSEFIEINEITTKNTYFIQGLDRQGTATWLRFLQCYSSCVGHWRKRRPALANIMMNGMIKHL